MPDPVYMVNDTDNKICKILKNTMFNKDLKKSKEDPRFQWLLKEKQVKKKGRHEGKGVT